MKRILSITVAAGMTLFGGLVFSATAMAEDDYNQGDECVPYPGHGVVVEIDGELIMIDYPPVTCAEDNPNPVDCPEGFRPTWDKWGCVPAKTDGPTVVPSEPVVIPAPEVTPEVVYITESEPMIPGAVFAPGELG